MKILILFFLFMNLAHASYLKDLGLIIENDPQYIQNKNSQISLNYLRKEAQSKLYLPGINFSQSQNSFQSYFADDTTNTSLTRLSLSYTLFNFGTDWNDYKYRDLSYKSFEAEYKESLIKRELRLIELLLQKVLFQENIKNQEAILKLKEQSYQISKQRFDRGTYSKNQLAKVKIDFYNSKSNLFDVQKRLNSTLAALSGYKIPDNMTKDFPFTEFFKQQGIKKIQKLKLGNPTPTLNKLNYSMEAEEANLSSRRNSYLGEFSIQYNRDKYFLEGEGADAWSSAIVYTLPLFENYSRERTYKTAKTRLMVAKRFFDFEKAQLIKQQEFAKINLNIAYENFKNRLEILDDSKYLYDSILQRFKKGLISINELVIEQDRLLQTRIFTNRGIYNLHLRYIEYIHQLGMPITQHEELFTL